MPRLARIVVPGLPHHVTQRGNRREPIFFEPGDYIFYREILAGQCRKADVACWAYCLMPNHVHLVSIPSTLNGLSLALGETHRRYTSFINTRAGWTGHLFQGRFSSVPIDEDHLLTAARYVSLNPVRAGLVKEAVEWRWSSVRAHLAGRDDALVDVRPLLQRFPFFEDVVAHAAGEVAPEEFARLRAAEKTGRPLGNRTFVEKLEAMARRSALPGKTGPFPSES